MLDFTGSTDFAGAEVLAVTGTAAVAVAELTDDFDPNGFEVIAFCVVVGELALGIADGSEGLAGLNVGIVAVFGGGPELDGTGSTDLAGVDVVVVTGAAAVAELDDDCDLTGLLVIAFCVVADELALGSADGSEGLAGLNVGIVDTFGRSRLVGLAVELEEILPEPITEPASEVLALLAVVLEARPVEADPNAVELELTLAIDEKEEVPALEVGVTFPGTFDD